MEFGSGPRTLVTHGGWTGNWELWEQQAEALSADGWRVIAYDHRGSGVNEVDTSSISVDLMVEDVFAVLDHFQIQSCVLAGESMGTSVAILSALRDPARFEGLVLVGGTAVWRRPNLLPFLVQLTVAYPLALRAFVLLAIPEKDVRSYVRPWALSILRQARPRAARKLIASLIGLDLRARLSGLDVPTLVIHGSRDRIVLPREGRALAEALPQSELLVLDGAGHVPTMTRPGEITAAIKRRFG
jgi:pimeloyl-ACP methyl ester carboxylesterase